MSHMQLHPDGIGYDPNCQVCIAGQIHLRVETTDRDLRSRLEAANIPGISTFDIDANLAATPQPPPLPGQTEVWPLVLEDIAARRAMGEAKYGMPMTVENGRQHGVDLLQELLDAVVYAKAMLIQSERQKQQLTETTRRLYALHDTDVEDIADAIMALVLEL